MTNIFFFSLTSLSSFCRIPSNKIYMPPSCWVRCAGQNFLLQPRSKEERKSPKKKKKKKKRAISSLLLEEIAIVVKLENLGIYLYVLWYSAGFLFFVFGCRCSWSCGLCVFFGGGFFPLRIMFIVWLCSVASVPVS